MTSQLAKNTFYLTFASVGQKIIAFVYFLFLARVMMPENTGAYFLATSIMMIFSVVADFGITPVIVREIAKAPENTAAYIRKALGIKLPFVALGLIGVIVASSLLGYDAELQSLIVLASVVLVLDALHLFFYGVLRGHQKLQYESLGMFSGMFTVAALGGLVLWLNPSLPLLILALAAGSLVNVLIAGGFVAKRFGARSLVPVWNTPFVKKILIVALPFALASVFVKVYSYVDSIMISKFFGTMEVGFYAIAYKFTYAFQFLPLAFVAALYPSFSSAVKNDRASLQGMFDRSMWYMVILATPIVLGLWLIAPEAVMLAGDEYVSAAPVLQALVFVLFPIFLDFPIGALLNAADRQGTKTAIMGVTMVISVVLNYLMIPAIGILGAAYAAMISFTFMFVAGLYFIPQVIEHYKFTYLISTIVKVVISGVVMLAVGVFVKPTVGWVGVIPVAAAVYLLMLVLTKTLTPADFLKARRLLRR